MIILVYQTIMCPIIILVCSMQVFKFLLGGRCNNYNTREWKNLCKCQTKIGALSDTPFLTVTAALLNNIIPIAIGRQTVITQ